MNVTAKHTQTPWRAECWSNHAPRTVLVDDVSVLSGKRVVAECERDEDAAYIVKAVNAHDKLVSALREARELLELNGIDHNDTADYGNGRADDIVIRIANALRAAGEPV